MRYDKPIPKTWSLLTVADLVADMSAGTSVNGSDTPATNGQPGVLKLSAVSEGRFFPSENKAVRSEELGRVGPSVRRGTLLISRSNTSELVGACTCIRDDYPTLHVPDLLWVIEPQTRCDPVWMQYVFAARPIRRGIQAIATGTSGSMKKISMGAFRKLCVPVPPLPEQQKIAAILSTWDRAFELTEKLIAAKQKRKQALMQQLLTGKVRLPGFEKNAWKKCHLGDVAKNSTRRSGSSPDQATVYSVTNSVGMIPMDEGVIGESIDRYKTVSRFDFAYNPMRINVGSIAMWDGDDDVLVSPDYVVYRCGPKLNAEFLNHFRRTHYWRHFVNRAGGGSVRVRIYFSDLAAMKLNLPPIEEQRAIAAVLNAQNAEIELFGRRLAALKQQKKGLMQQLLTGKVRVNVNAEMVKG